MRLLSTLSFLLALLVTAAQVQADRLPDHYPKDGFERTGIVDRVDFRSREIVVNDTLYRLSEHAMLHSRSARNDSLGRLRKGAKIGFDFHRAGKQRTITEIWLLPHYYGESPR